MKRLLAATAVVMSVLGVEVAAEAAATLAVSERPIGEVIAELVASGQAAIGIGQVSEMLRHSEVGHAA